MITLVLWVFYTWLAVALCKIAWVIIKTIYDQYTMTPEELKMEEYRIWYDMREK